MKKIKDLSTTEKVLIGAGIVSTAAGVILSVVTGNSTKAPELEDDFSDGADPCDDCKAKYNPEICEVCGKTSKDEKKNKPKA
jgi:recombinational DNA repair protein RecR